MVGNPIAYAMSVRSNIGLYYGHSSAAVPPTTRADVLYAYCNPRHSDIWLPTRFSIWLSIYRNSHCLSEHNTSNICMLWNRLQFPRRRWFNLHFLHSKHWNVLLYGIDAVRAVSDFTMTVSSLSKATGPQHTPWSVRAQRRLMQRCVTTNIIGGAISVVGHCSKHEDICSFWHHPKDDMMYIVFLSLTQGY